MNIRASLSDMKTQWPVLVKTNLGWPREHDFLRLTVEEAAELHETLGEALADAPEPAYVQVSFNLTYPHHGSRYTYIDPSGKLEVGELVVTSAGTARVVSLGRGDYSGPCKDITARLVTVEL